LDLEIKQPDLSDQHLLGEPLDVHRLDVISKDQVIESLRLRFQAEVQILQRVRDLSQYSIQLCKSNRIEVEGLKQLGQEIQMQVGRRDVLVVELSCSFAREGVGTSTTRKRVVEVDRLRLDERAGFLRLCDIVFCRMILVDFLHRDDVRQGTQREHIVVDFHRVLRWLSFSHYFGKLVLTSTSFKTG
jgi:hypothetical protein